MIVIVMPMKRKRNAVISECKCLSLLSQMLNPVQKLKGTLSPCGTSVNCRMKCRKGLALSSWNVYGNAVRELLWPEKTVLSSGFAEEALGWALA